jgi:hypothetical protein
VNTPIAACYLVEASYHGNGCLRVLDAAHPADYLRRVIRRDLDAGDADSAHGLYRYDGQGSLTELTLVQAGRHGAGDDYLERRFCLVEKNAAGEVTVGEDGTHVSFAVRVDRRSGA